MTPVEILATSRGSLETRLLRPLRALTNGSAISVKNLAVFLHPWSPLGGSMHDPVLRSLRPVFLSREFHVLLYNSRPSFTGTPEGQDLRELVAGTIAKMGGEIEHLVIMGYSHGSLIASLHPLLPKPTKTSHILLCYPISVRGLITFFRGGAFESALHDLVQDPRSNLLIMYGDRDQFTSVQRYEQWAAKLKMDARGDLKTIMVQGADHFWTERACEEMCSTVGCWLDGLSNL